MTIDGRYRGTWQDDGGIRPSGGDAAAGALVLQQALGGGGANTASAAPKMALGAGFFNNLRRSTSKPLLNILYGEALKDPAVLKEISGKVPTWQSVGGLSKRVSAGPTRIGAAIKGPGDYLKLMQKVPRVRGVAGLTGLFALLDAAGELRDPTDPVAVNVAEAGGKLAGTAGGAWLGGALGQALIPIPGVGWVVGSTVGGLLGSGAGKNLARGAYSIIDPNVDLNQQLKRQAIQNEINSARLAPMTDLLNQQSVRNRQARQDALLANAFANAQSAGASTVNTILSGGY